MPTWIERQPAQRLRSFRRKRGDNLVEARIAAQRVAAYLAVLAAARDLLGLIFNAEQTKAGFQQASRTNFSCCVTRNFCAALFADSDHVGHDSRCAISSGRSGLVSADVLWAFTLRQH
jgi:hypothetical protein